MSIAEDIALIGRTAGRLRRVTDGAVILELLQPGQQRKTVSGCRA